MVARLSAVADRITNAVDLLGDQAAVEAHLRRALVAAHEEEMAEQHRLVESLRTRTRTRRRDHSGPGWGGPRFRGRDRPARIGPRRRPGDQSRRSGPAQTRSAANSHRAGRSRRLAPPKRRPSGNGSRNSAWNVPRPAVAPLRRSDGTPRWRDPTTPHATGVGLLVVDSEGGRPMSGDVPTRAGSGPVPTRPASGRRSFRECRPRR
ncbi:hypothetical protein FXW78_25580 [Rhodococcus opacus]|nr:hypothetical protein [Rhodococcus opacus]